MKGNLFVKRVGAYIIDIIVIMSISAIITRVSFLNANYDKYVSVSNSYNDVVKSYYDKEISMDEFSSQTKILSYEMNKNGYIYIVLDIVVIFLYFGVLAYFMKGQTIGKKIMNIRIVSNKDKDLKLYNYFIRLFILNGVILNIVSLVALSFSKNIYLTVYGYASNFDTILMMLILVTMLLNKDGRGLHDMASGTKVIDLKN